MEMNDSFDAMIPNELTLMFKNPDMKLAIAPRFRITEFVNSEGFESLASDLLRWCSYL